MSERPWLSFSKIRLNFSKQERTSGSRKREQPVHGKSLSAGCPQRWGTKGLFPCQKCSTALKRPAENSPKQRFVFFFIPTGKEICCILFLLQKTKLYAFITRIWRYFLCLFSVATQWKLQQWQQGSKVLSCHKGGFTKMQQQYTEMKGKKAFYLQKTSSKQGSPRRSPHLHCQPLNEFREGVDPGSGLSGYSAALHAPELPRVGPAFHQVLNHRFRLWQHFCYKRPTN